VYLVMDANTLPKELWIHIFECINSPTDLTSVIRTSKIFYSLGIRLLCRCITWTDPRHFAYNLPFWTAHASLVDVPRSLTIGISEMTRTFFGFDPASAVVAMDGTWEQPVLASLGLPPSEPARYQSSRKPPTFFASLPLYQAMNHHLSSFIKLENLAFRNTFLPENMYAIIHSLPQLRRLSLQFCTLPPRQLDLKCDNSLLPITDLTLWGLRGDARNILESNYFQALSLTTAHNLRTLRADWTATTARYFAEHDSDSRYEMPQKLQNVEFRLPTVKLWPSEPWAELVDPLSSLLARCPTIFCLSIVNFMPCLLLLPHALPHLQSYSGPLSTVLAVTAGRPVDHLNVLDGGKNLIEVTNVLSILENRQGLKTLSISIDFWDDEILYPISLFFPTLQKLKILYHDSAPSEYTLLSMGSQFLYRLPELHTVQIYNPRTDYGVHLTPVEIAPLCSFPSPSPHLASHTNQSAIPNISQEDIELKDLILAWNKSCKNLREVQLVKVSVWRRAFEGDDWCNRVVERDEAGVFQPAGEV